MEDKDQPMRHPKPLEPGEPGAGQDVRPPARPSATKPSAQPFRIPIDSPTCRECLGAIAHRLAQPMTALRGSIELGLMGKRTAEDYRSILEQTLSLADTMVQMIVSLRDLGESLVPGGPPQHVDLKSVVEETLAEMDTMAKAKGLRFDFEAGTTSDASADPARLREALQGLLAWLIQNSAGGGTIAVQLSRAEGTVRVLLFPTRMDLQYLQIKMLDDVTTPGALFSHAAKTGGMGWAIHQRAIEALGGKLEMLTEGPDPGAIRIDLPMAPPG